MLKGSDTEAYLSRGGCGRCCRFTRFFWLDRGLIRLISQKVLLLLFMFVFLLLFFFFALLQTQRNPFCVSLTKLTKAKTHSVVTAADRSPKLHFNDLHSKKCVTENCAFTFLSLSLSFFFSFFSLLLFFFGSCEAALSLSPSSTGLFWTSTARWDLTGSFSLSASGLDRTCTRAHLQHKTLDLHSLRLGWGAEECVKSSCIL